MSSHSSYKDSGIEWVGEIPTHWKVIRPKHQLSRVTRPAENDDDVITCFRDGVVTLRKNRREDGFTNSLKEHGYQQILPGDLVVHEMDGFAGAIGISDSKGKATPVYTVIEPDGRVELKYVAYLLREMSRTGKIESLARSIRERTVEFRWNIWSAIYFPFPPLEEQRLIARYLDRKTLQIDSLVEKIERKIALLKERRISLINQCVTRGLDPNVRMRNSGTECIGKIPAHWEVVRLGMMGSFWKGKNVTKDDLVNTGYPVILYSHIYTTYDREVEDPVYFISENLAETRTKISKGTYMFASSGESVEDIGKCILYSGESTVTAGGDMVLFNLNNPQNFDNRFLSFVFNCGYISHQKSSYSRGEIISHIYEKQLREIRVAIPPKEEQEEICQKLLNLERRFYPIIERLRDQINLLGEYRQALVSAAVTGKIRVTENMT